ncbi:YqgE/AlgH family protein [Candidatus Binatus sp.]|uniref:YqgE/AlgH family protein n=1 Tax=Candidatus Binatus sp. TaxID=2811406 RepID=UPI002F935DFA
MRGFTSKLRGRAVAGLLVVFTAAIATLATAQKAQSTDLTTPSFLVATPDLQDPLFQHAVILMIPSTEPPLLAGVIINSPAKVRVRDMFPQARQLKLTQETMYLGGPVEPDEPSVIFRASSAPASATRIFDDTYVATGHDAIAGILKDPQFADLRVILGKAQWLRDQLLSEVMRGAWYVVPAKSELIFSDPKDLWSTLVRGGDLQEAEAGQAPAPNLPQWRFDATNWQRLISPN